MLLGMDRRQTKGQIPVDMTYREIVKALPGLTRDELNQLVDAIKATTQFIVSHGGEPCKDVSLHYIGQDNDDGAWMLTVLLVNVPNAGFSVPQLRSSSSYPSFVGKIAGLKEYLAKAGKDRRVQQALLGFGWRLLAQQIRNEGLPVSGGLLMRHAHRIPSVLDYAFPGYVEAGILHMIIGLKEPQQ